MVSKLVNLRLNDALLKKIDSVVKNGVYSTRTEFIKHVLIKAVEDLETAKMIKEIEDGAGFALRAGKKAPTYKEMRRVREEAGKEILKKYGLE